MGVTSIERGLTMEVMEEKGKKSVNWAWLNFFGPYGTPLPLPTLQVQTSFKYRPSLKLDGTCPLIKMSYRLHLQNFHSKYFMMFEVWNETHLQ